IRPRSADTSEPAWVNRKMLSMNRRTSRPSSSRKYSAIVRPVSPTRWRAPGGSFIWPNTNAVLAMTPDSVISWMRSLPSRLRSPTPANTDTPACSWATFRISSWMMTVLPTPAPPKMPTLPPFLNGQMRSMILRPVSNTSTSVVWSSKAGGARWIGRWTAASTGPLRSIARPRTSNTRPRVASPTGTVIGAPVSTTLVPRASPSVVVIATLRTQLLPRCCATSHTSGSPPSTSISTAFRIFGSWPAGNSMSTTGPVIWMTRPSALAGAAVAMSFSSSWCGSARLRAGRDFDHLSGDVGLAGLVVGQGEIVDELAGVLGRVLHRDHPARFLARAALQDRVEQPGRDVARQELLQHRGGAGLED